MADQHMSAREAWEIVQDGDPWDHSHESDDARQAAVARYARACGIVEAAIHAHEGLDELSDYDVPIRTVKVRALERGDDIPKVNVRGDAAQAAKEGR